MNQYEADVLKAIKKEGYVTQRMLAEDTGYSLGVVNQSVRTLVEQGYLNRDLQLTSIAQEEFEKKMPKRAVILAAGFGMRMVPINREVPKAFLEVKGERLIERIIRQLHETGIYEIYIVVGFMKELFEYLIDQYNVRLIVNAEYAKKNNLHSLKRACTKVSDCYVVPCDIWCAENPFVRYELYSWYMVSDDNACKSWVRVNRKKELIKISEDAEGNAMIGISYILEEDAGLIRKRIVEMCEDVRYDNSFWEEGLFDKGKMVIRARVVRASDVMEINTYEQLREIDGSSAQLKSDAIDVIVQSLNVEQSEITEIKTLKKGMTNRSFSFCCKGKKYIMRIPGEGTDKLIDRVQEAAVYKAIEGKDICDNNIYMNPQNGYKITEYLENARVCDPFNAEDVAKCMEKLRVFHEKRLMVEHEFDLYKQIDFYESLWEGKGSLYFDYREIKQKVFSLKEYIEGNIQYKCLTHIDAVPDNFLFVKDAAGREEVRLIDWEYAGMQDPHVDLAMFCIYSFYEKEQIDHLIQVYFSEGCGDAVRIKIYCYIAVCGLLWSNWCEYKHSLGIEFGEYSLRQYRYAKEYSRIAVKEIQDYEEMKNA